jgi:hypothetical protein
VAGGAITKLARQQRTAARPLHPVLRFSLIFSAIFVLHAPLLRLPYFWDEAGYYVPAARDLLLTGSLIPHSTLSNAHPPLALAWLALWWKLSGYTPAVTRTAMLLVAAFALMAVYELARTVANQSVAIASTTCTALYPVFFTQSSMAHSDLAAAALVLWGLVFYFQRRWAWAVIAFTAAVMAKETALLAPVALAVWSLGWRFAGQHGKHQLAPEPHPTGTDLALLLSPAAVLTGWYAYHFYATGYLFGNPEFVRYNITADLHPLRILVAFLKRLWQVTGYMNLFLLTGAAAVAMLLPAQAKAGDSGRTRERIALRHQAVFAMLVAGYVISLSVIGGAVLARYLLPVAPLIIIICASTVWRRVHQWLGVVAIIALGFVLALFVNPPYGFSLEDNLAYRDYVLLHKAAANLLAQRYPRARVLTAWPATDELSHPYLGYTRQAITTVAIENFSAPELQRVAGGNLRYDLVLLFSTKYEPHYNLLRSVPGWEWLQVRYFGYHRDESAEEAARLLGGQITYLEERDGQWAALMVKERSPSPGSDPGSSGR